MVKFLEDNVDIHLGGKDNKMTIAIVYSIISILLSFGTTELLISQEGNKIGKWRGSLLIRLLFGVCFNVLQNHLYSIDKNVATATLITIFVGSYFKYGLLNYNVWFLLLTVANVWVWQIMDNLENKDLKINLLKEMEMTIDEEKKNLLG